MFSTSKKLQEAADLLSDDCLDDCSDSSCTTGYDNDGSESFEVFENGFSLAVNAGDKKVCYIDGVDAVYFFIGSEEEVLKHLQTLAENKENLYSDDEDEDDEGEE